MRPIQKLLERFPDAKHKIYLDASLEQRGRRRLGDNKEKREGQTLEQVMREIAARDERDENREHSPLARADDAVYIDTSGLDIEAAFERIREAVTAGT